MHTPGDWRNFTSTHKHFGFIQTLMRKRSALLWTPAATFLWPQYALEQIRCTKAEYKGYRLLIHPACEGKALGGTALLT